MSDSAAIDAALVATLIGDATLMSLLPDGVFFGQAKPGAQRFVIVEIVEANDEWVFGQRAIEDVLYQVKAVVLSTTGTNIRTAAARIDVLLDGQILTAIGYVCMSVFREGRFRYPEDDDVDPSIRWQHWGGFYRVQMSLVGA